MLGYRAVLITCMLLTAMSASCFDLTPRFHLRSQQPTASLVETEVGFEIASIEWHLCGESEVTSLQCRESFVSLNYLVNISSFLDCPGYARVAEQDKDVALTQIKARETSLCHATRQYMPATNFTTDVQCPVTGYPGLENCEIEDGSHADTFWVYFFLRVIYLWAMNSACALLDSTSVALADEHKSDYAHVALWYQLAGALGTLVAGFVIVDPEEGSGGKYLLMDTGECISVV